jgi:hypothetical protein
MCHLQSFARERRKVCGTATQNVSGVVAVGSSGNWAFECLECCFSALMTASLSGQWPR